MSKIRYIDLCCGLGGFRLGINDYMRQHPDLNFECVFSADIKQDALKCYNMNFNENNPKRDIYDINELPDFDLLCAGFPCQPFSTAGNKRGFEDERGSMIFKILEICTAYSPQTVLLENVSNLITLEGGKYITKIKNMFETIGYNVAYKKLNSRDFGVPQSRERVFIVCTQGRRPNLEAIRTSPPVFLDSVIDKNAVYTDIDTTLARKILQLHKRKSVYGYKLQDKRGGSQNIHSWDVGYGGEISKEEKILLEKIMLERRKKHWAEKKNIKWMDGMPLTIDDIRTFYKHPDLQQMLDNLVGQNYLKLEKCKDLSKDNKRVYKEDSEPGYNICKGKLSFPISRILDPNNVSPTLTATDCSKLVFIINNEHMRRMTDLELKRISGFPDSYIIPSGVNKYDLFGNTVVPSVIRSILDVVYGN